MARLKLGVQISGRGSNLQSLIDACRDPGFPAEIVLAVSNVPGAQGLKRAEEAGIPTRVIPHKDFPSREAFDAALNEAHQNAGVDLVCNAGFMRLMTPVMVRPWLGRMINIHPSLLPAFPGIHVHRQVLAAGCLFTGCTVHYMDEGMDTGAIIAQAAVPVLPGDTEDTLGGRVLSFEHKIYPFAVRRIAEGKVRYMEGKAVHEDAPLPALAGLANPAV